MSTSRPKGIAVLAVVEILLGVFALVGGILHLTLGIGGFADFSGKDLTLSSQTASALQDPFTVEGLILLAAGFAVWTHKKWAWTLTVAISTIGLVTSIAALAIQSALSTVGLVSNVGILVYVVRKPVKSYFRRAQSSTAPAT